nr:secoisolariciresinol dehydrogenase-like [Tanacetum cinerariifolium]
MRRLEAMGTYTDDEINRLARGATFWGFPRRLVAGDTKSLGKRRWERLVRDSFPGDNPRRKDIQDQLGQVVCETIGSPNSIYVHCDVTNKEDVKNAVDTAYATYGKLDIMFNNAGIMDPYQAHIIGNEKTDFECVLRFNITCRFFQKILGKEKKVKLEQKIDYKHSHIRFCG